MHRPRWSRLRGRAGVLARAAGVTLALVTVAGVGVAAAGGSSAAAATHGTPPDAAAARVLAAAHTHLGDRYVYGGTGPTSWDCSGLTSTLWRTAGGVAAIPRTAHEQQAWAIPVSAADALPGDLVFFGRPATHVGLVEGGGWIVDASASLGVVVERTLWTSDVTYGRVPRPGAPAAAPTPTPAPAPTPAPTPATGSGSATRLPPTGGPLAKGFVAAARQAVGAGYAIGGTGPAAYDDGALLSVLWRKVSGLTVPVDRTALARHTVAVPADRLRAGDVLIYGSDPVWHVGVYVGGGQMVDASRSLGHVVLRPVLPSGELHYGRFPRH